MASTSIETLETLLTLTPEQIVVGERQRPINPEALKKLKESIAAIGLKTPISVRYIDDEHGYALVSGAHRLQACIDLGVPIVAREEEGSELDARLWEIAENLHRADLTELQRHEHLDEWRKLSEERDKQAQLAPVSVRGRIEGRGHESGVNKAARELGVERTEMQRAAKIAALAPEAKAAAVELDLDDNQSALLAAAKEATPEAQTAVLQQHKAKKDAAKAARKAPPSIPDDEDLSAIEPIVESPAVEAAKRVIRALSTDDLRIFLDWFDDYIAKRDL